MKQFSLKEYLEHIDRKVVTRDGRSARIICTDAKFDYPVVALITICDEDDVYEVIESYTKDGCRCYGRQESIDLFFAPEKHEGWTLFVISESIGPDILDSKIYATREEAQCMRETHPGRYGAIVKLEWEE